jgi:hypothetical protein
VPITAFGSCDLLKVALPLDEGELGIKWGKMHDFVGDHGEIKQSFSSGCLEEYLEQPMCVFK